MNTLTIEEYIYIYKYIYINMFPISVSSVIECNFYDVFEIYSQSLSLYNLNPLNPAL